jgi:hypothetical protein
MRVKKAVHLIEFFGKLEEHAQNVVDTATTLAKDPIGFCE